MISLALGSFGKHLKNTQIPYLSVRFPFDILKDKLSGLYEPGHEIANNVVCTTSKASDQPAHTHSLIRAFASSLNIL